MRQVVLHPGEDGWWVVECPSLPGCVSQGRTKEEALANIREAIEGYVAALQDDGLPVPEERFDTSCGGMTRLPRISGRECVRHSDAPVFAYAGNRAVT